MRTLDALRNTLDGKIYIYCRDEKTAIDFLAAAEKEGYRFGSIKPTNNKTDDIRLPRKLIFCFTNVFKNAIFKLCTIINFNEKF